MLADGARDGIRDQIAEHAAGDRTIDLEALSPGLVGNFDGSCVVGGVGARPRPFDLDVEPPFERELGGGAELLGKIEAGLLEMLELALMAFVHARIRVGEASYDAAQHELGDPLAAVGEDVFEPAFVGAELLLHHAQHGGQGRGPEGGPDTRATAPANCSCPGYSRTAQ